MIRHKLPLSLDHLMAAVLSATQAREFERGKREPILFHISAEHTSACISCVFATVAYLEADINEFFADAAEEGAADGIAKDPIVLARIRAAWELENRSPVLDKYDLALALCDQPKFDRGAAPYQAVALLMRLRNALIHFKPEWQPGGGWPGEDNELSKLSRSLMNSFPENGLAKEYQPYFIQRCLGYGSSRWAVTSSIAFVKEFRARLGVGFSPSYILPFVDDL
ncbi:MAG: hypothetical protein ACSLFE_06960 [Gemmatimonadaceae bacterium]